MDSDQTVSNWQSLVRSGTFDARSSLLVIQGYVRMLLTERAGPVTETQRKCLEEAAKATTRVLGVMERLEILARWDLPSVCDC